MAANDQPDHSEQQPACKEAGCDCPGFRPNPMLSTDCLNCHHDWQKHRRSQ